MSDAPTRRTQQTVHAAGAVLWRDRAGQTEVAVVHRPRYDDWSLPKGKVDSGETHPVTAIREIGEETGYAARLGRRLSVITYPVGDTTKRVVYWAAQAIDGEFRPADEVDELLWLPAGAALERLQYPADRKVLRHFTKAPHDTETVLIVRHGRAGSRSKFKGDDRKRPLDKHGRAQAESLVAQLLAFGATAVHAAPRVRCSQTVEPLAQELGVEIELESAFTEEAYAEERKAARQRLLDIAGSGGVPVICTQGAVIPDLISWWCGLGNVRPDKSRNRKGSTWVLSSVAGKPVAADHLGSPLSIVD